MTLALIILSRVIQIWFLNTSLLFSLGLTKEWEFFYSFTEILACAKYDESFCSPLAVHWEWTCFEPLNSLCEKCDVKRIFVFARLRSDILKISFMPRASYVTCQESSTCREIL